MILTESFLKSRKPIHCWGFRLYKAGRVHDLEVRSKSPDRRVYVGGGWGRWSWVEVERVVDFSAEMKKAHSIYYRQ